MRIIYAEIGKPITIGRIGENETTLVKFRLSEVAIPNATFSLVHKRYGDEASYPCATFIDGGYLCWEVKSSDVANVGTGRCELIAIVDEKVAKSFIYTTRTLEALDGDIGEVPEPYQPWVDSVLSEFAFSHKLENITCNYVSIPHDSEPHCDSEETDDGLILTFYIPMGEQGAKGDKGDKGDTYSLTEQDKTEIAEQIHYDDTELRAEIESKPNATHTLSKTDDANVPTSKAVADYVGDGNNLPIASSTQIGAVKLNGQFFYTNTVTGVMNLNVGSNTTIDNRWNLPLTINTLDYAVKAALTDGKGAPYTEAEKKSARERIGAEGGEWELIEEIVLEEDVVSIKRNVTPQGVPYNFKSIAVLCEKHDASVLADQLGWLRLNDDKGYSNWHYAGYGSIVTSNVNTRRLFVYKTIGNEADAYSTSFINQATQYDMKDYRIYYDKFNPIIINDINLYTVSNGVLPRGSKYTIYGIWA